MPDALSPDISSSRTYAGLRRSIETVLIAGRSRVEEAWVKTYHETGRLIHNHVLKQQDRANYGARLYARLSEDTGVSVRTLQECVQFHRVFPIARPVAQFGWNRCRLLCQIGDETQRARMVTELKRGLPTVELKDRVRALNAAIRQGEDASGGDESAPQPVRLLKRRRGTPDLYRLTAREEGLAVDVGFKLYLPFDKVQGRPQGLKPGAIVLWTDGGFASALEAEPANLYTYAAKVNRVIDGDTLLVSVALPYYRMDEKLRLRGLDCPEMDTVEGKEAKRFTESLLKEAVEVLITTSKVDKYDRYLADMHVRQKTGEEIHLNNALLREGHAVPMGNEEMADWAP